MSTNVKEEIRIADAELTVRSMLEQGVLVDLIKLMDWWADVHGTPIVFNEGSPIGKSIEYPGIEYRREWTREPNKR